MRRNLNYGRHALRELLPLTMLRPGEFADVTNVDGDSAWVCRMAELGLRAGSRVEMVQSGMPCLLRIGGCKLCLRADDGSQIFVRPLAGTPDYV